MFDDIIGAVIHATDDDDYNAELMAILSTLDLHGAAHLSDLASDWLMENGRCTACGSKLEVREFRIAHPECCDGCFEIEYEQYCSHCDTEI